MAKNIYDIALEFYGKVKEHPEAQEVLKAYDQVYQFEIKDGDPFYLEVQGGKLSVNRGETPQTHDVSKIHIDQETLRSLFEGKFSPAEGYIDNKWNFTARDFREGLFALITRIGQDIVREEVINKFTWK